LTGGKGCRTLRDRRGIGWRMACWSSNNALDAPTTDWRPGPGSAVHRCSGIRPGPARRWNSVSWNASERPAEPPEPNSSRCTPCGFEKAPNAARLVTSRRTSWRLRPSSSRSRKRARISTATQACQNGLPRSLPGSGDELISRTRLRYEVISRVWDPRPGRGTLAGVHGPGRGRHLAVGVVNARRRWGARPR
jgi:hypothetical protein